MEAEKSRNEPVLQTSSPNDALPSQPSWIIYDKIKHLYSKLDSRRAYSASFALLMSKDDFQASDEATQREYIDRSCKTLRDESLPITQSMSKRADGALRKCEKRHAKTLNNVYPPIDIYSLKTQHTRLHSAIGRATSFVFNDKNDPKEWRAYVEAIDCMLTGDEQFIRACWTAINDFDKYRNDLLRYYFTFYGLLISATVFLLVNLEVALAHIGNYWKIIKGWLGLGAA